MIDVLEAVHLLLAFPLFVCAVAVDPAGWKGACARHRKQLFVDEEHQTAAPPGTTATVGDYLEKIFQIPIWMAPIEEPAGDAGQIAARTNRGSRCQGNWQWCRPHRDGAGGSTRPGRRFQHTGGLCARATRPAQDSFPKRQNSSVRLPTCSATGRAPSSASSIRIVC